MTTTDLLVIAPDQLSIILTDTNAMEQTIARIEKSARSEAPDITSKDGRERIRSIAAHIAKTKAPLEKVKKDLTEVARKKVSAMNATFNGFRDRMDALRDEIRHPLTTWEAAETDRKAAILRKIEALRSTMPLSTSLEIQAQIDSLKATIFSPHEWHEYIEEVEIQKSATLVMLSAAKDASIVAEYAVKEAEAQKKELEELRAKQAKADVERETAAKEKALLEGKLKIAESLAKSPTLSELPVDDSNIKPSNAAVDIHGAQVDLYEITDQKTVLNWIAKNDRPAVIEFINAYVAKNHKTCDIDGVTSWTEKVAY